MQNADSLSSRWSLRKIEVWVAEGAGDILQFGGQISVAAILGFFKNQPIKFDVSLGRILKTIEVETTTGTETRTLPLVQLLGSLAPVQNQTQPTPDGQLRVAMFEKFNFQIKGGSEGRISELTLLFLFWLELASWEALLSVMAVPLRKLIVGRPT